MNRFVWLLLGLTVLRLAVAAFVPLSPDEAYYWVWSKALAPGYLDHPPMVALWIAAGTAVAGDCALGVRLLGPLGSALASWALWDAGRRLFPGSGAGRTAVWLLNASLLLGVGAVIMTPDTPLLVFWTATLWAAARIASQGKAGDAAADADGRGMPALGMPALGWWWLVAGLCAGLALLSKYTAVFLWVGLGAWLVLTPSQRFWLRRWQPYAGAALGGLVFLPVILWNARHGWAGLVKQGGRVADWQPARALGFLGELIGAQLGLATPLIFALCMIGLWVALARGRRGDARWSLLAAFAVPPILMFLQHAIGDRVQGNWPAIIYPALALAAGGAVLPRRWVSAAIGVGFAVTGLAYAQALFLVLPLPAKTDPVRLRLAGWQDVAGQVAADAHGVSFGAPAGAASGADSGTPSGTPSGMPFGAPSGTPSGAPSGTPTDARSDAPFGAAFIAVEGYGPASELAWWHRSGLPVLGVDSRWALTDLPVFDVAGLGGLLLRPAGRQDPPDPALWADAEMLSMIARPGSGSAGFALYRVTGRAAGRADAGLAVLPRRSPSLFVIP